MINDERWISVGITASAKLGAVITARPMAGAHTGWRGVCFSLDVLHRTRLPPPVTHASC